jgi:hypothetical protein
MFKRFGKSKNYLPKSFLVLALILAVSGAISVKATYYEFSSTRNYYSNGGTRVAYITFETSGDSTPTSGTVYSMSLDNRWAGFLTYFKDLSTWTSYYPNGIKANGKWTMGQGLTSSLFTLPFQEATHSTYHVY